MSADLRYDYKQIDFVFLAITSNKGITVHELFSKYEFELTTLEIDKEFLTHILDRLISDGYIINGTSGYRASIDGLNFLTYSDKYFSEKSQLDNVKKTDVRFKIFGIVIPIFFGLATITFGILNYINVINSNKKDKIIQRQVTTIDSLRKAIFNQKKSPQSSNQL